MGSITKNIIGSVVAVAIGGSVYTVSQTDIVSNFSKETGMSQQESQKYVEDIQDDLVSWSEVGDTFVTAGEADMKAASEVDCENYTYEWVSDDLTCENGKAEIYQIGNDELLLGRAYKKLSVESSDKSDIPEVIRLINVVDVHYDSVLIKRINDAATIDEMKKSNLYNKATLQAVLEAK